jgi:hypothetical protein
LSTFKKYQYTYIFIYLFSHLVPSWGQCFFFLTNFIKKNNDFFSQSGSIFEIYWLRHILSFNKSSRGMAWWWRAWDLHSMSRVRVRTCISYKSLEQLRFYSFTWTHKIYFLEMRIVRIQIIIKKYCLTMKSIFNNKCISFFQKKKSNFERRAKSK